MTTKETKKEIKNLIEELKNCKNFTVKDRLKSQIKYLKSTLITFDFYYKYECNGKKHIVKSIECKKPQQTKVYKTLEQNFNIGLIEVYGYQVQNIS